MKMKRIVALTRRIALLLSFSLPLFLWLYACGHGPGLAEDYLDLVVSPRPSSSSVPTPNPAATPSPSPSPSPIAKYLTVVSEDALPLRDLGDFSFFSFNGYLYAGGGTMSYGGTNYSVFRSSNGSAWTTLSLMYPPKRLISYDGKLWGFRNSDPLVQSSVDGSTWISSASSDTRISTLTYFAAIDTGANKGIYALTSTNAYKYDEDGKTWTSRGACSFTWRYGASFFSNGQSLYITGGETSLSGYPNGIPLADTWRSDDGGANWNLVYTSGTNYNNYVFMPQLNGMAGDTLFDNYYACQETYAGDASMYFVGKYHIGGGGSKTGLGCLSLDFGYISPLVAEENFIGATKLAVLGSRIYVLGAVSNYPTVWRVFSYQLR